MYVATNYRAEVSAPLPSILSPPFTTYLACLPSNLTVNLLMYYTSPVIRIDIQFECFSKLEIQFKGRRFHTILVIKA